MEQKPLAESYSFGTANSSWHHLEQRCPKEPFLSLKQDLCTRAEQRAAAPGPPHRWDVVRLKQYLSGNVVSPYLCGGFVLGVCQQQEGGSLGWTSPSRSGNFGRSSALWLDLSQISTEGFQVCSLVELAFFHLIIFPSLQSMRLGS